MSLRLYYHSGKLLLELSSPKAATVEMLSPVLARNLCIERELPPELENMPPQHFLSDHRLAIDLARISLARTFGLRFLNKEVKSPLKNFLQTPWIFREEIISNRVGESLTSEASACANTTCSDPRW